jgi:DNA-binding transcriptional LysR family regulator
MSYPLDLDLLKTFVAVVESGSLSSAAPRVSRSQSAVSMQMQRLEQTIGKPLLVRGSRTIRPNAAGEDLLVYARRLLKLSDEALASVTRPQEAGLVRLGIPDDYAAFLLPSVLSRFAEEHPLITIDLVCEPSSALLKLMAAEQIDLAVITRQTAQPFEVLRRERFVWVASPNHVTWMTDPLPVALFDASLGARAIVLTALARVDRAYRCNYSSASFLGLITVVQAGLAVAALAECSVPTTLKIIGENEGLPPLDDLDIGILRTRRAGTVAIDRLTEFLRRELAQGE